MKWPLIKRSQIIPHIEKAVEHFKKIAAQKQEKALSDQKTQLAHEHGLELNAKDAVINQQRKEIENMENDLAIAQTVYYQAKTDSHQNEIVMTEAEKHAQRGLEIVAAGVKEIKAAKTKIVNHNKNIFDRENTDLPKIGFQRKEKRK